jgi:adenylate cyclase
VGNVRAADRFIYTAIGDVVNLAARLEGLTRSLDAAVAIDAATYTAAGDAAAHFTRHGPALVKGRDQVVEVYFLPLAQPG